jgi:hypothetical protein
MLDRGGNSLEPADGTEADIEIEDLPERHIEAPDAAANRRGERSLDPHEVLRERVEGLLRKPDRFTIDLVRLLAGVDLVPGDLPFPSIGLLHCRVEDTDRGSPDIGAGAVPFDERDDRIVRDMHPAPLHGDRFTRGWRLKCKGHGCTLTYVRMIDGRKSARGAGVEIDSRCSGRK